MRGFVATYYEGFYFDSDQAIVGLMARHLAALHDFPVFFYGQNYLLGVQAWIAAPVFAVVRSSVAAMRLPFVALNAAVAVALIVMLSRSALRPAIAFVAALPFIVPTPATANQLLDLSGACVEPFVYVLLLWRLRGRPLLFGGLLAIAFLHREFTIAIVPAMLLATGLRRSAWTVDAAKAAARAALGFFAVWLIVDDVKMRASGPALGQQAAALAGQMCMAPEAVANGIRELAGTAVPVLFGWKAYPLRPFRMDTSLVAGSAVAGGLVLVALAVIVWRIAANARRLSNDGEAALGVYLALTGVFVAGMYPLSCNIEVGLPPLLRYLLLAVLVPVGAAAVFFVVERSWPWRALVASLFVVWGLWNVVDNARLIRLASAEPPLDERRVLTDYLIDHHIRYARAIYWDAYVVDFFSRERVITSSLDTFRIPEYQKEVDEHRDAAVVLERQPCDGQVKVSAWCVQK